MLNIYAGGFCERNLNNFAKSSKGDVWKGPKYTSLDSKYNPNFRNTGLKGKCPSLSILLVAPSAWKKSDAAMFEINMTNQNILRYCKKIIFNDS